MATGGRHKGPSVWRCRSGQGSRPCHPLVPRDPELIPALVIISGQRSTGTSEEQDDR